MDLLVFFDIDNTLIKSSAGHVEAMLQSIAEVYGLNVRIDVINHHGMTDSEIVMRILEQYDVDPLTIKSYLKDCLETMRLNFAEIVKSEKIVLMQGVVALLAKLKQNSAILGLVTGNLEPIAWSKLKKVGIDHFFSVGGFGSDHINRANLMKIALQRAEAQFDFSSNRQVFHFGDAPQDMQAGRQAGVVPLGITTGIYNAGQLKSAGAEKVLPDLKDTDAIWGYLQDF